MTWHTAVSQVLIIVAAGLVGWRVLPRPETLSPGPPYRPALLNREGRAGAQYWAGVAALLDGKAAFAGREHRGTEDPVNAALNYGYGILQSQVWSAITLAGLEPFAGFIHVDRPGKPSLVLDLMEEFRQPVVDRPGACESESVVRAHRLPSILSV